MERDSFLFYRSFYEALKDLPKDIQVEVYTAIMEYALYGNLPKQMKPFANSVFTLVKPILDTNLQRYENGKKGGRKRTQSKSKTAEDTNAAKPPLTIESYALSFSEETERMKTEAVWKDLVCKRYSITPEEVDTRLDAFSIHCNCERGDKPHTGLSDAKRHFQSWMRKAYPSSTDNEPSQPTPPTDYTFNGGFGGMDT